MTSHPSLLIRPRRGLAALNLRDLWVYRELVYFMTWRELIVRYKQTVLGVAWVVLQPVLQTFVFTLLFGRLAGLSTEGLPKPIFYFAGLLPWSMFDRALQSAGRSLVTNRNMLTKIYFPRLIIPLASVLASVVDFLIAFAVLVGLIFYYNGRPVDVAAQAASAAITVPAGATEDCNTNDLTQAAGPASAPTDASASTPSAVANEICAPEVASSPVVNSSVYRFTFRPELLTLPLFVLLALITALGVSLWLSALNVIYRDVGHVLPFLGQLWFFITPVVYSSQEVSVNWQWVYALNPMVGVVEGFRWALLGAGTAPGPILIASVSVSLALLASGLVYFRNMERTFADEV